MRYSVLINNRIDSFKVSPYELEQAVAAIPGVDRCVVIGIPDARSGQLPKAFISLKQGAFLDEQTVHTIINGIYCSNSYKPMTLETERSSEIYLPFQADFPGRSS